MKYKQGNIPLGLGNNYKFGIEIEVFNVNTSTSLKNLERNISEKFKGIFIGDTRVHKSLYHSRESNQFFKQTIASNGKPYKKVSYFQESLVGKRRS